MKRSILFSSAMVVLLSFASCAKQETPSEEVEEKTEAAEETKAEMPKEEASTSDAAEWKKLSLADFRNYQGEGVNEKWVEENGVITLTEKGGGDIITKEQYAAFEIMFDFKISEGGNSGLMYHVLESEPKPWQTGPEMQIQDNKAGKDPQKAGWLYQLYEAEVDTTKPVGEWNTVHLIITPEKCEHFMNGTKYVEYVKGSEEWDAKVAASKFSKFENFGKPTKGHVNFQDHGNVVSFRNIKIKSLD
ncbi:MAG: DUF1080 domain-containing protein [Verrucomicrobiota bacterium]